MLFSQQMQLVVLTPETGKYFGNQAKCIPYKFEHALPLLSKASVVLSKDLDFLYLARVLFSNISLSLPIAGAWSWKKNHRVCKPENVIYVEKEITPHTVIEKIKEA